MEQFIEQITPAVLNLAVVCITAIFSYVGMKVKAIYNEKVNTEIKKDVVNTTVKYVEQVYKDIHGEDKLNEALKEASSILSQKGIPVSDSELKVLIEAAVNALNKELSE